MILRQCSRAVGTQLPSVFRSLSSSANSISKFRSVIDFPAASSLSKRRQPWPYSWYFYSSAASEASASENLSQKAKAGAPAGGPGSTPGKANEELPEEDPFLEERKELVAKVEELNDKYKRALAEIENVRRRLTKQVEDAKIFGIQSICKDLLDVADVLGLATQSIPREELAKNAHLKSLFDGLVMTETQLKKVFERHGLSIVNPVGEQFDPNFHEALFEVADESKSPGSVAVVAKIGYKLKDRCLRPAQVGVAKKQ